MNAKLLIGLLLVPLLAFAQVESDDDDNSSADVSPNPFQHLDITTRPFPLQDMGAKQTPFDGVIVVLEGQGWPFLSMEGNLAQTNYYGTNINGVINLSTTGNGKFLRYPVGFTNYWRWATDYPTITVSRKWQLNQYDIPSLYEFWNRFGTGDNFFAASPGGDLVNTMYLFAGTSHGVTLSDAFKPERSDWRDLTIFDALNAAGITWKIYYQYNSPIRIYHQLDCNSPTNQEVITINPFSFDVIENPFERDLTNNTLPQVCFVVPDGLWAGGRPLSQAGSVLSTDRQLDPWPFAEDFLMETTRKWIASSYYTNYAFIFAGTYSGGAWDSVQCLKTLPEPGDGISAPSGYDFKRSGPRVANGVASIYTTHTVVTNVMTLNSITAFIEYAFNLPWITERDHWCHTNESRLLQFFDFSHPNISTNTCTNGCPTTLAGGNRVFTNGCEIAFTDTSPDSPGILDLMPIVMVKDGVSVTNNGVSTHRRAPFFRLNRATFGAPQFSWRVTRPSDKPGNATAFQTGRLNRTPSSLRVGLQLPRALNDGDYQVTIWEDLLSGVHVGRTSMRFTVDTVAPSVPSGLAVITATNNSPSLSWGAVGDSDLAGYELGCWSDSGVLPTNLVYGYGGRLYPWDRGPKTNILFFTTNSIRGTNYVMNIAGGSQLWAVRSVDLAGNKSAWSTNSSFTLSNNYILDWTNLHQHVDGIGLHLLPMFDFNFHRAQFTNTTGTNDFSSMWDRLFASTNGLGFNIMRVSVFLNDGTYYTNLADLNAHSQYGLRATIAAIGLANQHSRTNLKVFLTPISINPAWADAFHVITNYDRIVQCYVNLTTNLINAGAPVYAVSASTESDVVGIAAPARVKSDTSTTVYMFGYWAYDNQVLSLLSRLYGQLNPAGVHLMAPERYYMNGLAGGPAGKTMFYGSNYIDFYAVHDYAIAWTPTQNSPPDKWLTHLRQITQPNTNSLGERRDSGKPIWITEGSPDCVEGWGAPTVTNMAGGLRFAELLHRTFSVLEASVYTCQRAFPTESPTGTSGGIFNASDNARLLHTRQALAGADPLPLGLTTNDLVWPKTIYATGNYSKFIAGHERFGSMTENDFVHVSTYRNTNSGHFAIVAINHATNSQTLTFQTKGFTTTNVVPWITDATRDLQQQSNVGVTGTNFSYTFPALSVTTLEGTGN